MKPCLQCGATNDQSHKFCRQCGNALDLQPATVALPLPADATVRLSGKALSGVGLQRTLEVDRLFAGKKHVLIGRAPECDIYLPHPTVSRHHARLEWQRPALRLVDLESVNGVFVGGQRIQEFALVQENERVGIGPFMFCLSGGLIHFLDSSQSLRLEARHLEKTIWQGPRQIRKLLDDINLAVEPGEFISLLGPSGSGKSTLMDCLNGRRPATGGKVLANGEDFYLHFDSFRQSLGYVPQRDIVHTQLSVYRALYYTARLRLPTDTGPAELTARIQEVLKLMELEPNRDTLVGNLSGGQIKRVSLGAELLARPCLLYIDEATSGLDAGTEARMMHLFRNLANEGRSVICITHNVDNVDLCNLILILCRGKLVYFGPPGEARSYFGVSRISQIYDRLAGQDPEAWENRFQISSLHEEYVARRLELKSAVTLVPHEPPTKSYMLPAMSSDSSFNLSSSSINLPGPKSVPHRPKRPPLWHQFAVLTVRYAELIWNDRHGLRLLLFQAPVVALFILLGFINKPYQLKVLAPRVMTPSERQLLGQGVAMAKQALSRWEKSQAAKKPPKNPLDPLQLVEAPFQKILATSDLTPMQRGALEYLLGTAKKTYLASQDRIKHLDIPGKCRFLIGTLEDIHQSSAPVVPDRMIVNPQYTYMLLFLMVLIVLWFGCNNASKEIVKEEAIYGRERAVNLGILPYLSSKFLLLSLITAFQTLVLMVTIYGVLEFMGWQGGHDVPAPRYYLPLLEQFGVLVVLSMTSVAMGLLMSACVATPDRANALLPYVLIPQIILGGGILSIRDGPLYFIAVLLSPAYWAFRAIHVGVTDILPVDFPGHMNYPEDARVPVVALGIQMAALLLLTTWFLRKKDLRKG